MKRIVLPLTLATLVSSTVFLRAQDRPKPEETEKTTANRREIIPSRVQVVFSEYEGEKKISSLPYTLLVNAEGVRGQKAAIRMGLRLPVATSSTQFQYVEVGTNMDGWAAKLEDGRFVLHLSLERTSSYSPNTNQKTVPPPGGYESLSAQPIIQQFKTEVELLMRDGQTIQSTLATDPVSARVSKVDVTLNVLK